MSGEVRLWAIPVLGDGGWLTHEPTPNWQSAPHIALPAAEFEAWRRVVEAARELDGCYDIADVMLGLAVLRKALGSMPSNQPPGPAGAKEGE